MASDSSHIANPLSLMAIFAGVSEAVGAAALPFVAAETQAILVWFVVAYPSALMALFFLTLWQAPERLYGPSDYREDASFLRTLRASAVASVAGDSDKLHRFWKPDGRTSVENETRLKNWLGARSLRVPISYFLSADEHRKDRAAAVAEFDL